MAQIKDKSLTREHLLIIRDKNTERPNTGEYNLFHKRGTYLCRACGWALFRADSKFSSSCGWPSFDVGVPNAIKYQIDQDGSRREILCAHCDAHLGHVFDGEGFTQNNRRYCVNSLSLDFIENIQAIDSEEAIVAGGCFWGMEYYFQGLDGVLKTEVGYTGGTVTNPNYQSVCAGNSGHFEALRIVYSPTTLSYEAVIRYFFEIHDPTQSNGQGPDLGTQYQSAIFYYNEEQKQTAQNLINHLRKKGLPVVTQLLPVQVFWKAEASHQLYYEKTQKKPYCHIYTKRF